jgi:hypothetical protein
MKLQDTLIQKISSSFVENFLRFALIGAIIGETHYLPEQGDFSDGEVCKQSFF